MWRWERKHRVTSHDPKAYASPMPEARPSVRSSARHARLFRNGRNQAVRIPREFELSADEVLIYREDDRLVIEPVNASPSLAEVLSKLSPLEEDFADIADPAAKPEDFF